MASSAVTAAAHNISKGNATLALQLIGYDQDLTTAMQYVFGSAFICKVNSSRLLCLHMQVAIKHVSTACVRQKAASADSFLHQPAAAMLYCCQGSVFVKAV